MKDLTQGAIWRHLVSIAVFISAGLFVQTLYLLVDLYFVGELGKQAVAGVASAASATLIAMSSSQLITAGSLSLISRAIGRKDLADAQTVFEQALGLSLVMAAMFLAIGYWGAPMALRYLTSDAQTAADARAYLFAYLPSLAMMFPGSAFGSALRASGVVLPSMIIQSGSVLLNIALAPVLIMGWGTGVALGVSGAGLASSFAFLIGNLVLLLRFNSFQRAVVLRGLTRVRLDVWRRLVQIGLPATGEFAMIFITTATSYFAIRHFGAQAQAGYGIGSRLMQAIFLPAMAISLATGPIAGQNFGAGKPDRVRSTLRSAAGIGVVMMLALTLLCQLAPRLLVRPFSSDPQVLAIAVQLLKINSLNFVAVGLSFCCSGMFQALGNTWPALVSSASRILTYVAPALWLSGQAWVSLVDFWYLSVFSVTLQAILGLALLRREFRIKLAMFTPHFGHTGVTSPG